MTDNVLNLGLFTTTRWTMVLRAGIRSQSTAALEELCHIYWFPAYAYVRRHGYAKEDAEDITQGFFAYFLNSCNFSSLNSGQGKFRAFLLASLKNYTSNERERNKAAKRGGGITPLSLDWEEATKRFEIMDEATKTPEEIFDREWAISLLQTVLTRLRKEWIDKGKETWFNTIEPFLTLNREDMQYSQASCKLGVSEGNLRVTIHRLRKRYRELLKDEIAQTLSDPSMIDEELRSLLKAFS